mmetsp:Transcript_41043/g.95202  ORF Transcript_41043/g.95202 Transcript_41043/m.95202 type:complete len:239 (-) Transcript_41043:305-1021(-)
MPKMGALAVSMKLASSSYTRDLSISARLWSVMSCPTATTPTGLPVTSRRVLRAMSTITIRLFLVLIGHSRFDVSIPRSPSLQTVRMDSRAGSATSASQRSRPTTSSLEYPVMEATFSFHSLTSPSLSTPKMGALAVSKSIWSSCATRIFSCIMATRLVTTLPTTTSPTIFPDLSRLGVGAMATISSEKPAAPAVCMTTSKSSTSSPPMHLSSTSWTLGRVSRPTTQSSMLLPLAFESV